MRKILLSALGGAIASLANTFAFAIEPEIVTYREVNDHALEAHIFMPEDEGDARPAALLFHGGAYRIGSPAFVYPVARTLAGRGMVAIAPQYRLSKGDVTPLEALDDGCHAFRWARANADKLGIDPARVVAYGVSAGGHLVAATTTVGCLDNDRRSVPDALLLWSPALDTSDSPTFEELLQGRVTGRDLSPAHHVRTTTPPTVIVHGDADTLAPIEGARLYCERLNGLGGRCELHEYAGVGHLLSRNLDRQVPGPGFDPDPEMVADGLQALLRFLAELDYIAAD